ncbi:MAG TPA: hypothetical protein DEP23_04555 [Ruminococcaceae bacterium]|nr:hypothetical protein [Oscillospiraceae bacterium]
MKIQFDSAKWSQDSEGFWLKIRVKSPAKVKKFVSEMQSKLYDADIKIHREKRSLDANAYFWLLTGKLATKIHIPVKTIYRQYIKDIGDNFEIVPVRDDAKEQWMRNWKSRGIGWVCEDIGKSKLKGYSNIICYYGSSTYNTAQMSRLIDLVVQDCQDQDIETKTPDEIARMEAEYAQADKSV